MDLTIVKDASVLINIIGAGNCFLLSCLYLRKENNYLQQSDHILSLLFFILGTIIINTIFNFTSYNKLFYVFEPLTNAFIFAIAPLLYLYVIFHFRDSRKIWLWSGHLFLFYVILILTIISVWIPDTSFGNILNMFMKSNFIRVLWNIHFLFYLIIIITKFREIDKDQSQKMKILVFGIASIWFLNLLFYLYAIFIEPIHALIYLNITLLFSGMTLLLFYQKLRVLETTSHSKAKKTKTKKWSSLSNENDSIIGAMQENKYYRDPNLDIRSLSEELKLPYHELSTWINREYRQNFNEFINSFRIKDVIYSLENQQHHSYTIMGLAQRAGFKSASAFYASFKKEKGTTPTQYIKLIVKAL